MSLWWCPKCHVLSAPECGPCQTCGTLTEYAWMTDSDVFPEGHLPVIHRDDMPPAINEMPNDYAIRQRLETSK